MERRKREMIETSKQLLFHMGSGNYWIARFNGCYGISWIDGGGLVEEIADDVLEEMYRVGYVDRKPNGSLREGPPWDYRMKYSGKQKAAVAYYGITKEVIGDEN
ncbi:MAG: hypothetical protein WC455_25585 [Dehalococcoidia bacterium]